MVIAVFILDVISLLPHTKPIVFEELRVELNNMLSFKIFYCFIFLSIAANEMRLFVEGIALPEVSEGNGGFLLIYFTFT